MTLVRQLGAAAASLGLLLGACVSPLPAAAPLEATAVPVSGSGGASASRQIRGVVATETVRTVPATRAPLFDRDAPVPTPLPAQPTAFAAPVGPPLSPPQPTLVPPARPQLDPASQAAADANVATVVAVQAKASATAAGLPTLEIIMKDLAFAPQTLTVKPGTIVIWKNLDRVQHQVQGGEFDSGRIGAGSYWAATLGKPGRFAFVCSFHPTMRAEIEVSADDTKPIQLST
jgi:plastocyanin